MKDLAKPLGDIPDGHRLVLDGEVWHNTGFPGIDRQVLWLMPPGETASAKGRWVPRDAPVLHLDGGEPLPLRRCKGQPVWLPTDPHAIYRWDRPSYTWKGYVGSNTAHHERVFPSQVLAWPIVPPQATPDPRWQVFKWPDGRDAPWSVWREGDDDTAVHVHTREQAVALADLLNRESWTPPEPEPARPSAERLITLLLHERSDLGLLEADRFLEVLAEHGYAVVDVRALDDAIAWLKRKAATNREYGFATSHEQTLLEALGQPADSDVPS